MSWIRGLPKLGDFTRRRIVGKFETGDISAKLNMPLSTVNYVIDKFKRGEKKNVSPRSGRTV